MNKELIKLKYKFSVKYRGVSQFLEWTKLHVNDFRQTRCPCNNGMNSIIEECPKLCAMDGCFVNFVY